MLLLRVSQPPLEPVWKWLPQFLAKLKVLLQSVGKKKETLLTLQKLTSLLVTHLCSLRRRAAILISHRDFTHTD